MDFLGTLSIVLELSWILLYIHHDGKAPTILRVARITKLAVRSKEIFRLFAASTKMFRLYRPLVNHLKAFASDRVNKTFETKNFIDDDGEEKRSYTKQQLRILDRVKAKTQEVNEAFAFRVSAICMILTIILPFLQISTTDYSPTAWIMNMKMMGRNEFNTNGNADHFFQKMNKYFHTKRIALAEVEFESPYLNKTYSLKYIHHELRIEAEEINHDSYWIYTSDLIDQAITNEIVAENILELDLTQTKQYFLASTTFDLTNQIKWVATFSMLSTTLVILVIFFGTQFMTTICVDMLITPLSEALLYGADQHEMFQVEHAKEMKLEAEDIGLKDKIHHLLGNHAHSNSFHNHKNDDDRNRIALEIETDAAADIIENGDDKHHH